MSLSKIVEGSIASNLRKVIQLGDSLRDCGIGKEIPLPRIVVIGTQSAGKSSVLESIVGFPFLPRGSGVVTRTPLEIRMVKSLDDCEPYAIFGGSDEKFTEFELVKTEIERLTCIVAGGDKNIVDKPITLSLYSKDVPNLTLIDLPGITRIPIQGQDKDIEKITREMTMKYIEDKRTIILSVVAANQDVSTSDGLMLAMKCDPKGDRTCAVLTKIDMMGNGNNALSVLKNEYIPLKHGWNAVKLRDQQEINEGKSVQEAKRTEDEFFNNHPAYKDHLNLCGTANLSLKLSNLLYSNILEALPEIRKELNIKIETYKSKLEALGEGIPDELDQRGAYVRNKFNNFQQLVKSLFKGEKKLNKEYLKAGTQGKTYLQATAFTHKTNLQNTLAEILTKLTEPEIVKEITDHQPESLPGFYNSKAFKNQVVKYIDVLSKKSDDYIKDSFIHIKRLIEAAIESVFGEFAEFKREIRLCTENFLEKKREVLEGFFEHYIAAQKDFPFTCRNDLIVNCNNANAVSGNSN